MPVILDVTDGPFGTIRGHVARANPQWRRIVAGVQALAIFTGPDAYVSPSWYPTKKKDSRVVPTWNYVAVHVYGSIEFFVDTHSLLAVVTDLTQRHEAEKPDPWAVTDAPPEFIDSMLKAIVGFRLPISRIDGKRKLSQNRLPNDRTGVIEGLKDHGGLAETAIADLMVNTATGSS